MISFSKNQKQSIVLLDEPKEQFLEDKIESALYGSWQTSSFGTNYRYAQLDDRLSNRKTLIQKRRKLIESDLLVGTKDSKEILRRVEIVKNAFIALMFPMQDLFYMRFNQTEAMDRFEELVGQVLLNSEKANK